MTQLFRFAAITCCVGVLAAVSAADDSWVSFAGCFKGSTVRLVLIPGDVPGTLQGGIAVNSAPYKVTGTVSAGKLTASCDDLQHHHLDLTATLDGETLNARVGNQDVQLPLEVLPGINSGPGAGVPIEPGTGPKAVSSIPNWLTPGTRVIYFMQSATTPGSRYKLIPDPMGTLKNTTTGQLFSIMPNWASQAAMSYTSWDILGFTPPTDIAFSTKLYLAVQGLSEHTYLGEKDTPNWPKPLAGTQLACLDPASLAAMPERDTPEVKVFRCQYPHSGKTYNALSLIFTTKENDGASFYRNMVYDLDTGRLIHMGQTARSAAPARVEGVPGARVGDVSVMINDLVETRQMTTPWMAAGMPQSLVGTKMMVYQGTSENRAIKLSSRITNVIRFHDGGTAYLPYHLLTYQEYANQFSLGGLPMIGESVTGPASLTPLAIDPAILATLQNGQVIDDDPVLRYRTSVIHVGPSQGKNVVVIAQFSTDNQRNTQTAFVYDMTSGLQIEQDLTDPAMNIAQRLLLVGKY